MFEDNEDGPEYKMKVLGYMIKCTRCGEVFQHKASKDTEADMALNQRVMELHMRTTHASSMDKANNGDLRSTDRPRGTSWRVALFSWLGRAFGSGNKERMDL